MLCASWVSFLYARKDDEIGTSDAPPKPTPEVWENFQNADCTLGVLINIFDFLDEKDQGRLARVNRTLRAAALKRRELFESLDLSNSGLTDEQLRFVVQQHPNLKRLSLRYCPNLTDEGLAVLGQLHQLEEIDLSNTALKEGSLMKIAEGCPYLMKCSCYNTEVTSKGLTVLGSCCKNITSLETTGVRLTYLSFIPQCFPNLTELPDFYSDFDSERSAMAVAIAEKHKLRKVNLSGLTSLTDADLNAFTECPIASLNLGWNRNLTARGIAQAISKMSALEILHVMGFARLTPNEITEIIRSAPLSLKNLSIFGRPLDWDLPSIQSFCQAVVQRLPEIERLHLFFGEGSHFSPETLGILGQLKELQALDIVGIVESSEVDWRKGLAELFKGCPKLLRLTTFLPLAEGAVQAPDEIILQVVTETRPHILTLCLLCNIRHSQSVTSMISGLHELEDLCLNLSSEGSVRGEEILPVLAKNCKKLSRLSLGNVTLSQRDISVLNQFKKIKDITIGQLDPSVDLSPLNRLRLDNFRVQDTRNLSAADIERFCTQLKDRGFLSFINSSLTEEQIQSISVRYHVSI
ncbi:MAG: hypothetical protein A2007_01775 [Verrucomicrobia bacterium GWC2_42_7]|nr:MAG: hypothetical protein A2007_01775 [Verrucomicrobia bacterium GWC2_42_7]